VSHMDFLRAKTGGHKLSMVTCYDYTFARLLLKSPIDGILVNLERYPDTFDQDLLLLQSLGVETVREASGLAMSSRNTLLSAEARDKAAHVLEVLTRAVSCAEARAILEAQGFSSGICRRTPAGRLAAVNLEGVRLIDNVPVGETKARRFWSWPCSSASSCSGEDSANRGLDRGRHHGAQAFDAERLARQRLTRRVADTSACARWRGTRGSWCSRA
jgi:hypothetical protein